MRNSSMVCVDANMAIRLVVDPENRAVASRWQQWRLDGIRQVAPTLFHYEVTNGLYRYQKLGWLSPSMVATAQRAALLLPIDLIGDAELHRDAYAIATRFNMPAAYDAHYVALAERLNVEFWTVDERLWRRVNKDLSWVRLAT